MPRRRGFFVQSQLKVTMFDSVSLPLNGVIAEMTYQPESVEWRKGLRVLADVLAEQYGADHEVVVYEAARLPVMRPLIIRVPLGALPEARVTEVSTLFVPPKAPALVDPAMLKRLRIPEDEGYPFFPQERLMGYCARSGISCIDLLPALRCAGKHEVFILDKSNGPYDVWHLTRRGHDVAAAEIRRSLRRGGLIAD